ncbi:MAG: hypothetical protein ACTSP5_11835 [Candidatus Heimdallarchaeota archaeon]
MSTRTISAWKLEEASWIATFKELIASSICSLIGLVTFSRSAIPESRTEKIISSKAS